MFVPKNYVFIVFRDFISLKYLLLYSSLRRLFYLENIIIKSFQVINFFWYCSQRYFCFKFFLVGEILILNFYFNFQSIFILLKTFNGASRGTGQMKFGQNPLQKIIYDKNFIEKSAFSCCAITPNSKYKTAIIFAPIHLKDITLKTLDLTLVLYICNQWGLRNTVFLKLMFLNNVN